MSNLKKKITGSFDLILLFGRGITAFSGTKAEALRSMWLSFSLFPLSLLATYYYPPKGMEEGYTYLQMAQTITVQYFLSFLIANGLVWLIAKAMNRADKFLLYFEAVNWVGIVFAILTLPFAIMAIVGLMPREEMDRVLALISCYGYIVGGCVTYRAFNINWQLAAAITIVTLFVNEELWNVIYAAQGIPQPW